MPANQIREKFQGYEQWVRSVEGMNYLAKIYQQFEGENASPNFRLLLIAHSNRPGGDLGRLVELFSVALELPAVMRNRL